MAQIFFLLMKGFDSRSVEVHNGEENFSSSQFILKIGYCSFHRLCTLGHLRRTMENYEFMDTETIQGPLTMQGEIYIKWKCFRQPWRKLQSRSKMLNIFSLSRKLCDSNLYSGKTIHWSSCKSRKTERKKPAQYHWARCFKPANVKERSGQQWRGELIFWRYLKEDYCANSPSIL